ncbi:MAG: M14 family zinc carboxypeptidase, partial [Phycisphaerae bacterium]|nr:M14 family zinc carboxypeptidase [Phycisphaerae bacterium]
MIDSRRSGRRLAMVLAACLGLSACTRPRTAGLSTAGYLPTADLSIDANAFLQALHRAHGEITDLVRVGTSVQGRPIQALRICDHPRRDEFGEPAILITTGMHAREQQPLDFARRRSNDLSIDVSWNLGPFLVDRLPPLYARPTAAYRDHRFDRACPLALDN